MNSSCELNGICDVLGVVDLGGGGEVVLFVRLKFKSISCNDIMERDSDFVITDGSFSCDGDWDL